MTMVELGSACRNSVVEQVLLLPLLSGRVRQAVGIEQAGFGEIGSVESTDSVGKIVLGDSGDQNTVVDTGMVVESDDPSMLIVTVDSLAPAVDTEQLVGVPLDAAVEQLVVGVLAVDVRAFSLNGLRLPGIAFLVGATVAPTACLVDSTLVVVVPTDSAVGKLVVVQGVAGTAVGMLAVESKQGGAEPAVETSAVESVQGVVEPAVEVSAVDPVLVATNSARTPGNSAVEPAELLEHCEWETGVATEYANQSAVEQHHIAELLVATDTTVALEVVPVVLVPQTFVLVVRHVVAAFDTRTNPTEQ